MTASDPAGAPSPMRESSRPMVARALLLGDRIDASGLERADMISANPLAFHTGSSGFVVLYRFGVAMMVGLSPLEEDDVLKQVKTRLSWPHAHIDDETASLEVAPDREDKIPGGDSSDTGPDRVLAALRTRFTVACATRVRGNRGRRRRFFPKRRDQP